MGRDIAVAGLVLTADEWLALDVSLRAQLLAEASPDERRAARRGVRARGTGAELADAYEAYELVLSPAG